MAAAESPNLLTDIRLALRHRELRPVYEVADVRRRVSTRQGLLTILDLETVSGRDNLAQAIVVRLLTPRGELAALGHPEYGSRLHELTGRQNTETTRNLVKLFILESLQQEPRIAKIVELVVAPSPGSRDRVDVRLRVQPIGTSETVTVGPFTLELEQ
jgi:phage baseplate assembly protein W